MARPTIHADRRRDQKIWGRVSKLEKADVTARAKRDHMTVSDEVRRAVGLPPADRPYETELLARINAQMGKIGSNANQCARAFNEGGYPGGEAISQMQTDVA